MKTKPNTKVKDYLTKEKWFNSEMTLERLSDCLSTAITKVYGFEGAVEIREKVLKELGLVPIKESALLAIYEWNDAPERTFEDVHNLCVKLDI